MNSVQNVCSRCVQADAENSPSKGIKLLENSHINLDKGNSTTIRSADMGALRTFVFTVACGLLAANLYYAQPLISAIGSSLHVAETTLGLIVTLTQIGYCLGLLFVVPLADRMENRKLVCILVGLAALAMASAGLATSATVFFASVAIAGLSSVGAQVLVPLAAHLSPPSQQGRVIGTIMAGLLTGVMLARPVSSALAGIGDWRLAFLLPAGLLGILAVTLWMIVPDYRGSRNLGYGAMLRSMFGLLAQEPVLRRRAFYQACLFCAFNLFWTGVPLLLNRHFGFGHEEIALFALAGAGGALAAPLAGRMADRGLTRIGSGLAMLTLAVSFALMIPATFAGMVIMLALLAIALDAGTQANQVLSQNVVYSLRPEARGRINAIYMAIMFVGGAIGSALAPLLYIKGGWNACALAGTILALVALGTFATEKRPARGVQ